MTTLRVLIDAAPAHGRAFDFALVDDSGARVVRRGHGDVLQWPRSDRVIAVVASPLLFVATLKLPPIGAARLGDAVRYALDDYLAAPTDTMHITHDAQQRDGRVRTIALSRELMRAIVAFVPNLVRVVAEPTLLAADADWHWTFDAQGRGFLLRADASAVPVLTADAAPAEIVLALKQARRAAAAPVRIVAHGSNDSLPLPANTIEGVPVVRGASWSWDGGGTLPADATQAPDLRHGEFADPATLRARGDGARGFRPAAIVALAALALFALASVATWAFYALDARRDAAVAIGMAQAAGGDAQDFDGAIAVIARRYADARHAARQSAPDDALPLLARAAPALAALPPAKWKRAIYASGAWTLEFAALDTATRDTLLRGLADAGLTALSATGADGTRVRIQS
ncbi:MAG TPA: type II secretion system protein GspL [Casimicrobiaceae bacterium]